MGDGDDLRIFRSRWFRRFATSNAELGGLGGEVTKQRIAKPGEGRSKGYRTIILFRRETRAFFVYGFAKSQRANVTGDEQKQFKEAAKYVLALSEKQLTELLKRGDFTEVI